MEEENKRGARRQRRRWQLDGGGALDMAELWADNTIQMEKDGGPTRSVELVTMYAQIDQAHSLRRIAACLEQMTGRQSTEE